MKNRLSFLISYFCVLALLTLGVAELCFAERGGQISRTEKRTLQAFPTLSAATYFDGSYMDDLESWLSDSFFDRDKLIDFSRSALELFSLRAKVPEVENLDELNEGTEITDTAENDPAAAEATPDPAEMTEGTDPSASAGSTAGDATLCLVDSAGERVVMSTFNAEGIQQVADVLNTLRGCLDEDGRVTFICSPTSSVMNSVSVSHDYEAVEMDLAEKLQPLVDEGVQIFDEADILGERLKTEAVFSVLDHHWTALGASYTADAMLEALGVPTVPYGDYRYLLMKNLRGSSYDARQLSELQAEPGNLRLQVPPAPYVSTRITKLTEIHPDHYLDYFYGNQWGYDLYTGGVVGLYRMVETGYHTGRNVLLIGDSFFQAFAPYVAPYYDTMLMLDPRPRFFNPENAGAGIRTYIEQYDIDDIFFITCDTGMPINAKAAANANMYNIILPKYLAE